MKFNPSREIHIVTPPDRLRVSRPRTEAIPYASWQLHRRAGTRESRQVKGRLKKNRPSSSTLAFRHMQSVRPIS